MLVSKISLVSSKTGMSTYKYGISSSKRTFKTPCLQKLDVLLIFHRTSCLSLVFSYQTVQALNNGLVRCLGCNTSISQLLLHRAQCS
ncbi:hypothetical protein M758_2G189800 [Ceratodon purpureus]|uniref:Uncharacterized protein n=1 Tax=Ceratodon purpureus TaxID=3225 RepID=A0A8T0GND9_CERPU|nr:hypothetical protein KC19_10G092100 [Ceratodon purpureus]KAG0586779.1 hypothetical protein KC19_2G116500 [Ceratodon purpureus]KAG0603395.1 hypothetical protein M758_10G090500 [Ceratodon purpureus]KAG0627297.1 hypothetical protein M758_2G189800 [Ceratodon purpureus]